MIRISILKGNEMIQDVQNFETLSTANGLYSSKQLPIFLKKCLQTGEKMPIENERNRRFPILPKLWKCCLAVFKLSSGELIVHCNAKSTPIIP